MSFIKTQISPLAIKNGKADTSGGKIYSSQGSDIPYLGASSNLLLRGKDGYLRGFDSGEPQIEHLLDGSSATYFNKTYRNEMLFSNDFVGNWINSSTSDSISDFISPDGTKNATLFYNNVLTNGLKSLFKAVVNQLKVGEGYNLSFYAKYDESLNSKIGARVTNNTSALTSYVSFDLENLTTTINSDGAGQMDGSSIEDVGNNWRRCTVYGTNVGLQSTYTFYIALFPDTGVSFFFTNDYIEQDRSVIYGAQLVYEEGGTDGGTVDFNIVNKALPYIPTDSGRVLSSRNGFLKSDLETNYNKGLIYYIDLEAEGFGVSGSFFWTISLDNNLSGLSRNSLICYFTNDGNRFEFVFSNLGVVINSQSFSGLSDTTIRRRFIFALSLEEKNIRYYQDGVLIATQSLSLTVPLNELGLSRFTSPNTGNSFNGRLYNLIVSDYDEEYLNKLIAIG